MKDIETQKQLKNVFTLPKWEEIPAMDFYMDQLLSLINPCFSEVYGEKQVLTSTMVNNYVKINLIPAPVHRRYSRDTVAQLFVIVTLKPLFNVQEISQLIKTIIHEYSVADTYNRYAEILMHAVNSAYSGEVSRNTSEDEYIRLMEDVAIAAAYQLVVKYRLRLRKSHLSAENDNRKILTKGKK